jgi:hypothetical protein
VPIIISISFFFVWDAEARSLPTLCIAPPRIQTFLWHDAHPTTATTTTTTTSILIIIRTKKQ